DAPRFVHLIVRIRAEIEARRELDPLSGFDEDFLADDQVAHRARRIVQCFLRKEDAGDIDEAALRESLRVHWSRPQHRVQGVQDAHDAERPGGAQPRHGRRIAGSMKSSSFIGTLYSSLSSVRRVRLPRRKSAISNW